jgi:LysM repeat protein
MDYNNLSSSTIYIGQELSLIAPHSQKVSTYTVKSGDTLYLIANQYQTTVTALKNSNHLTSDHILVGKI